MVKLKHRKKKEDQTHDEEEQKTNYRPTQGLDNAELTARKTKKKKENKDEEKSEVKIEIRSENPDKVSPIIGYFPSGYDPLRSGKEESEAKVKFYKNTKWPNRMQLVVSPNAESQVNFVGTSYSGEATAPQMCTYRLGVLDKSTQTLKIVPIAANKIFRLEPRVGALDQPENGTLDNEKHEETTEERNAMMRELTLKYSSKKTIRQVKKLDSLRQKQDPETKKDLNLKLAGVEINKDALKVVDINRDARNIPPHDLAATTPETAYPLNKIIFEGEWDYLVDILELSNAGAEFSSDVYPSFVCNRVYKLDNIKDATEKRKLAGIFSYITHLIKFKDKHSMDGVSSAKKHKFPGILFQRFSSLFSPSESDRIPDDKRDLLINYILVLTLYADNFRTDLSDIAKDLRMNAIALRPYYEYLGCKLVKEKQMTLATLPLPLQFPTIRRKRRR